MNIMRLALAIPMWFAACGAFGQSPAPAFEVVSIKPVNVAGNPFLQGVLSDLAVCSKPIPNISGNGITMNVASLCGLILFAYDYEDYRISGAPAWMAKADPSIYFEIEAKAPLEGVLDLDRAKEMFRTVLADRFQLKFHHETKDAPVYNLVAAKGGPKLSTQPLPPEGICGDMQARMAAVKLPGRVTGTCVPNMDMEQIVYTLTHLLERPVLDKTGLTGKYAFNMRWSPEGMDPGSDAPPSIFTAIQEQLGLKLEPAKAPLEFIVIDRAERPSTN